MIRIVLSLNSRRCITKVSVEGHALRGDSGNSVPCAAVSALTGTAARLISSNEDIVGGGSADAPGMMILNVVKVEDRSIQWLQGITDFLVIGLKEVEREYPAECSVVMNIQED